MKPAYQLVFVALFAVACSGSSGRSDTGLIDDSADGDTLVATDDGAETHGDAGRDAAVDSVGDVETDVVGDAVQDLVPGDLLADDGTSADVAVDVDQDFDGLAADVSGDGGDDAADDVEPADAAEDNESDVGQVGMCTNENDQSIIQADPAGIDTEARDCYMVDCLSMPGPVMCTADCVVTNTGISSGCGGCYAGRVECTFVNCLAVCLSNLGSQECLACQEDMGCTSTFQDCAGA